MPIFFPYAHAPLPLPLPLQASWLSCVLTCFAGSLLSGLLCGEAVLSVPLGDPLRLAVVSAIWYLTFYAPSDAFNKVTLALLLLLLPALLLLLAAVAAAVGLFQ